MATNAERWWFVGACDDGTVLMAVFKNDLFDVHTKWTQQLKNAYFWDKMPASEALELAATLVGNGVGAFRSFGQLVREHRVKDLKKAIEPLAMEMAETISAQPDERELAILSAMLEGINIDLDATMPDIAEQLTIHDPDGTEV